MYTRAMLSPAVSCGDESYNMNGSSTRLLTIVYICSHTCASAVYSSLLFEGSIYFAHTVVQNSTHFPSLPSPHHLSLLNAHSPLPLSPIHKRTNLLSSHPNRIVLIVSARQRRCVCFVSSQNTRWRREL